MEKFSKLLTKLKHVLQEDDAADSAAHGHDAPLPHDAPPEAMTPRPPRRTLGAPLAPPPLAANPGITPAAAPPPRQPASAPAEIIDKLPRELPRYQRKPKAAPAGNKAAANKLPVIGLDDVQRNLRRDLTRREKIAAYDGKPIPQPRDLPLIDPREVRANVQQLHSGRQPAKPAPLPPVILQPTPVMKKASASTPLPLSPLAQQERERAAAALFGPQSSFSKAEAQAPRPASTTPAEIQADWRGASHAAEARAAGVPLPPQAPVEPVFEPASSDTDAYTPPDSATAYPQQDDFVLDDEFALPDEVCDAAAASDEPTDAPIPAAAPVAEPGSASTPPGTRWQQLRQPVAVPAAPPVWQGVRLRQAVGTPASAEPAAMPQQAASAPLTTASTPAAQAGYHSTQHGDIVWHLLDDEADNEPSEAPAAANPGLVWQLLDDAPQAAPAQPAAASPVPVAQISQALHTLATAAQPKPHAIPVVYGDACLPSLDLLRPPETHKAVQSEDYLIERGILIEEKCAEFKVKVAVVDAYAGPVITRYEVEPAVGVRGSQVVNLAKDLSRALGLASIRVVETIPGKTCMGLELPNPQRQMIRLSEIFSADVFQQNASKLTLALGQDISGAPVVMDLAKAPHLLVAGTTGSGKSVGVNAMILSMLYKATPDEVRFIMIDPKMLELSVYNDIPHLLAPVVTDMKLAANALNWCVGEMEKTLPPDEPPGRAQPGRLQRQGARCRSTRPTSGQPVQPDTGNAGATGHAALHRGGGRRVCRPDDGGRQEDRGADRTLGAESARRRHPLDSGHSAAVGGRDYRPDQGQHPHPHRVPGIQQDR